MSSVVSKCDSYRSVHNDRQPRSKCINHEYVLPSSANIPVSQTQFGVTHPSRFCDIQNWSRNLSKLKYPSKLEYCASFEYTVHTPNSGSYCLVVLVPGCGVRKLEAVPLVLKTAWPVGHGLNEYLRNASLLTARRFNRNRFCDCS